MIVPYIDATPDSLHFQSIQRIGATGILRGEGIPYKWANQTWFYPNDYVNANELKKNSMEMLSSIEFQHEYLSIADARELIYKTILNKKRKSMGDEDLKSFELFNKIYNQVWNREGLKNFDVNRNITRLEFAVMLDKTVDPFGSFEVDHNGLIKR
jgi:hypothetical protein